MFMKMYCSYCRIASSNSHYKGTQAHSYEWFIGVCTLAGHAILLQYLLVDFSV